MRTPLIVLWLLLTAAAGWWLVNVYKAKSIYDTVLKNPGAASFAVKRMDEQDRVLLSEVRDRWRCREDSTNSNMSQLLTQMGLAPSLQGVTHVLQSPLPQFSWSSGSKNRQAAMLAFMRIAYSDLGTNHTLLLAEDGHLALLQSSPDIVVLFQEHAGGIREAFYFRP